MSDTTSSTQYEISGGIGVPGQQDGFDIRLTTTSGMTDEAALALVAALKNVAWPAGSGITTVAWVFKSTQTTVTSPGNLSATPPAFT